MKYSRMQKIFAAALLLAFTAPSGLAGSTYGAYNSYSAPYVSSTSLSSTVSLTDKNDKITLSLRDSDVKQVLRMFADKVGLNVVFHESVNGKVTLDLVDMPVNEAFNLVLQIAGLSYYKQNNTLIVLSKDSEDNANFSKQEMMTFPVKYVSADKIANFLNKNVFSMKKAGLSGVEAATVNSATNEVIVFGMPSDAAIVNKVIEQFDREPLMKTFAVNHTTPAEMADMICNMLLPSRGVGAGSSSGGGTSMVPTNTPTGGAAGIVTGGAASSSGGSELKLGEGVVACTASASGSGTNVPFDMQNLAIAYYPQRGTITLMGGSEAQMRMIENFIKTNDIKQPQAYLELSIVELNEDGSKTLRNNWDFRIGAWKGSFDPGTGTTQIGRGSVLRTDGVTRDSLKALYGNSARISWYMSYLISNNKARVLANPKILITNGKESTIDLTTDYVEKVTSEYLTSTNTSGEGAGVVQKSYTIGKDKGIKVNLTPFISPEGYVTLNVKNEYATDAGEIHSNDEEAGTTSDLVATLLSRRNIELSNARIKDGETLVIAGLIQEREVKDVYKIPVLGDLPFIGAAFRGSNNSKTKTELVLMITPKIINDGEDSVADSL